jgi:phosphate-selective porin OprO and OprP
MSKIDHGQAGDRVRRTSGFGAGPGRLVALGLALASAAVAPAAFADEPMTPTDPLAGFSDGAAFLRSPDNEFVLLPSGRLQIDGLAFARPTKDMPVPTFVVRRARLELGGWIGPYVFFNLAGDFAAGAPAGADPVAQSFLATTDDYVGVAPFGDRAILQVGQFDAPFTLENRTSDKYFDFMERSITVRSFAVPSNKEVGAMIHGQPLTNKGIYYSLGVFNGDGQNFRNVDTNLDFIGRAWVAPFAFAEIDALKAITLGGSIWAGKRGASGLALASQSTQGGFKFADPKWTLPDGKTPAELHQIGNLNAYAFELNVPVAHRFGFRFEYVRKLQGLEEDDISAAAAGKLTALGQAKLDGWSAYGELWAWVLGDDRIIGEPGIQMPTRLKKFKVAAPRHGLMLTARVDNLKETITTDTPALKDSSVGTVHVISPELGVNYWYSKRFRATFNYGINVLGGDTSTMKKAITKNGEGTVEHEFMIRLGIAL